MVARKPGQAEFPREAAAPPSARADELFEFLGDSPAAQRLLATVARYARRPDLVLIEGETGTGKELVARALHRASAARGAFVAVDCGALDPRLFGSELFGHVPGAFTGADAAREGAFLAARGGTLFLDEIQKLTTDLQRALMRALTRRGAYKPIGTDREVAVACRILAATNEPLALAVERGRFLADLYQRLTVLHLVVPPLRERAADIAALVVTFAAREGLLLTMDPIALALLERGPWPGNVRELENGVLRLAAEADSDRLALTAERARAAWPSLGAPPRDRFVPIASAIAEAFSQGPMPDLLDRVRAALPTIAIAAAGSPDGGAALLGIKKASLGRRFRSKHAC